jgi:hypothetical protein
MAMHRKNDVNTKSLRTDKEKIIYLFFQKCFSIEEIEKYFGGKYTYKEVKDIIRGKYKAYYDKENANGR